MASDAKRAFCLDLCYKIGIITPSSSDMSYGSDRRTFIFCLMDNSLVSIPG
jgi:hypothetical protein